MKKSLEYYRWEDMYCAVELNDFYGTAHGHPLKEDKRLKVLKARKEFECIYNERKENWDEATIHERPTS